MVIPSHFSVSQESVRYQSLTKLSELVDDYVAIKRLDSTKAQELLLQISKLRIWLKALDYSDFLTQEQRYKIVYCLTEIAGIYEFPTAPVLANVNRPAILIGGGGGTTTINNNYDAGTPFLNSDVDSPSEVVDTFAISLSNGVRWEYTIINSAGTALRKGSISAGWLSDGSDIDTGAEVSTAEIGDTSPVTLDADVNAGNVRLIATVSSNNWIVQGKRYLD